MTGIRNSVGVLVGKEDNPPDDIVLTYGYGVRYCVGDLDPVVMLDTIGEYDHQLRRDVLSNPNVCEIPLKDLTGDRVETALNECGYKFCEILAEVIRDYVSDDLSDLVDFAEDRYDCYILFCPAFSEKNAVSEYEITNTLALWFRVRGLSKRSAMPDCEYYTILNLGSY